LKESVARIQKNQGIGAIGVEGSREVRQDWKLLAHNFLDQKTYDKYVNSKTTEHDRFELKKEICKMLVDEQGNPKITMDRVMSVYFQKGNSPRLSFGDEKITTYISSQPLDESSIKKAFIEIGRKSWHAGHEQPAILQ
jgi:hypothetical protein